MSNEKIKNNHQVVGFVAGSEHQKEKQKDIF